METVPSVLRNVPGKDDICDLTRADQSVAVQQLTSSDEVIEQDENETGKSTKHSKDKR